MNTKHLYPRWWRLALIALGTLILCSCSQLSPTVDNQVTARNEVGPVAGEHHTTAPPVAASQAAAPERTPLAPIVHRPPRIDAFHLADSANRRLGLRTRPDMPDMNVRRDGSGEPSSTMPAPQAGVTKHGSNRYQGCATCAYPSPEDCFSELLPHELLPHELLPHELLPHGGQHAAGSAPWKPPGISTPWPPDEYVCDGGDYKMDAAVARDWSVLGLDREDTVAHYDTIDGETVVEASNRCCIYAPRFAAVRKVYGVAQYNKNDGVSGVDVTQKANLHADLQIATTAIQPVQPVGRVGTKSSTTFLDVDGGLAVHQNLPLAGLSNKFLPYEDLQIIHNGTFDASDKARLAKGAAAAVSWTREKAVQVLIDDHELVAQTSYQSMQTVFAYKRPPGKPQLRVVKVASKKHARSGETVEFTIRFDNVGEELIGNVTIVDHLTTRLGYVPDTAECSLNANFSTEQDIEQESLVMRWEIVDPMKVGEGGVIRFQCKVR